jgi:hypothetical protein
MAGARKPVVEVRRSQRRRRTVSRTATVNGHRADPDQFSRAEESEWSTEFAWLAAREGRLTRSDANSCSAQRLINLYPPEQGRQAIPASVR